MKKITMFLLAGGLMVILSGCAGEKNKNVSEPAKNPPKDRIETAAQAMARKLCENKDALGLLGYEKGSILRCGDFFSVHPSPNVLDAPVVMFDRTGKQVAYCGGMPGPVPRVEPDECKIQCQETGVSLCPSD